MSADAQERPSSPEPRDEEAGAASCTEAAGDTAGVKEDDQSGREKGDQAGQEEGAGEAARAKDDAPKEDSAHLAPPTSAPVSPVSATHSPGAVTASEGPTPLSSPPLESTTPAEATPGASTRSRRPTSLLLADLDAAAAAASLEDPHALVIASLRAQIDDLNSQLTGLNTKLVKSFERIGSVEAELDHAREELRGRDTEVSELQAEQAAHLAALDTGLLVEQSHVKDELARMMERVIAETAAASTAQQAKEVMEGDLDDLSASLFDEANRMVAVERLQRAKEEDRRKVAEERLSEAEAAVRAFQGQVGEWVDKAEHAEKEADELRSRLSGSPTVAGANSAVSPYALLPFPAPLPHPVLTTHAPYLEFLSYLTSLALTPAPPRIPSTPPTLPPLDLTQPFLKRALEEDIEPTLRLDLSRTFGILTRGRVLAAIVEGSLELEPATKGEFGPGAECALTGRVLIPHAEHPQQENGHLIPSSFLSSLRSRSYPTSSTSSSAAAAAPPPPDDLQLHVFRVGNLSNATRHPIDPVWALPRLRAVCEFWRWIRTVQRAIILGEGGLAPPSESATGRIERPSTTPAGGESGAPAERPDTPRRRSGKIASLWSGFGSRGSQPNSPTLPDAPLPNLGAAAASAVPPPLPKRRVPPPQAPSTEESKPDTAASAPAPSDAENGEAQPSQPAPGAEGEKAPEEQAEQAEGAVVAYKAPEASTEAPTAEGEQKAEGAEREKEDAKAGDESAAPASVEDEANKPAGETDKRAGEADKPAGEADADADTTVAAAEVEEPNPSAADGVAPAPGANGDSTPTAAKFDAPPDAPVTPSSDAPPTPSRPQRAARRPVPAPPTDGTATPPPLPQRSSIRPAPRASVDDGKARDATEEETPAAGKDEWKKGEPSWEEKRWVEVVRLKEACFWARINGSERTLQS